MGCLSDYCAARPCTAKIPPERGSSAYCSDACAERGLAELLLLAGLRRAGALEAAP